MTALLLAMALLLPVSAQDGPAASADPSTATGALLEPPELDPPGPEEHAARTREIASDLRCPVCQGLSVADSNADAARAMYQRIDELVGLGYYRDQIEGYFVDRYGAWVQLAPPREGLHWIIWLGPVFVLVVGGVAVAARASKAGPPPASAGAAPSEADAEDPFRRRILEELGELPPRGSDGEPS